MNRFALAAAVMTLSLLSSCALMRTSDIPNPGEPKPSAAIKEHFIIVTVVSGKVDVDVPTLELKGNGHKITWYLDNDHGQDYQFSDDSIDLEPVSKGRYDCKRNGKYHFRCKDTQSGAGKFKYDIAIKDAVRLDPLVVNN